MKVTQLLDQKGKEIFTISESKTTCEAIAKLNEKQIGALIVIDDAGEIAGIISERDILRAAFNTKAELCDHLVKEIMTPKKDLITTEATESVAQVMHKMTEHKIRHLPVLRGKELEGIVSIGDVVKHQLKQALTENEQMKEYIAGY